LFAIDAWGEIVDITFGASCGYQPSVVFDFSEESFSGYPDGVAERDWEVTFNPQWF
jgi:hypothetical protein